MEAGTDELVLVPIMIGTLSLTCTYSGIPPADNITWLHNGTDLDPSDPEIDVEFTATASTLTVTSLEETGGGMYECRPENVVGSNGATTQVRIQCECVCVCVCVSVCRWWCGVFEIAKTCTTAHF